MVKEVKLMAQAWGIRIHQYLDDWLIQTPTRESWHSIPPRPLPGVMLGSQASKIKSYNQTKSSILWITNMPCYTDWSDRPKTDRNPFCKKCHSS